MAAAPKALKYLSGATPKAAEAAYGDPAVPLDLVVVLAVLLQLQNTVNELISRHNQLCTDTAHAGDAVTGAGAAATNLFTNA